VKNEFTCEIEKFPGSKIEGFYCITVL